MVQHLSSHFFVLLADDDDNDRILFKDAIDQLGFPISLTMHDSGVALMNYLKNKNNILPDFLFLDLNMHCKNGFECLEEIRSDERLRNINVIVYSTSSRLEDVNETLNLGANLYFAKSSTFQELVNRLQKIFTMNWNEYNTELRPDKFVFSDEVAF